MPCMRDNERSTRACDVLILGGGPAGSATALALKRRQPGLRVVLVEKTDYSAFRIGETLAPPATTLLAALGVWDAFAASSPMPSFGTRAAWSGPELYENEFIFSPHGHGWHLDRREFDALLCAEASRAGVEVILQAALCGQPRRDKRWILAIQPGDGCSHELSARFVVDATGRRAWFASSQGARRIVHDQLAGAFVFFRFDPAQAPADTYTSVEACEHGWWYSAMLPKHRMVAAFMSDAAEFRRLRWRKLADWNSLAAQAPHTAARIAAAIPLAEPALHPASSQCLASVTGDDWLAVGDAASTFDPLSSQGIVKALRSGIYAAHVIASHLRGHAWALKEYADHVAGEYANYLEARAAYYRLEQRWPDSPFWRKRREATAIAPWQTQQAAIGNKRSSGGISHAI